MHSIVDSRRELIVESDSENPTNDDNVETPEENWKQFLEYAIEGRMLEADPDQVKAIIETLTIDEFIDISRSIKNSYGIRLSDDKAEYKFIIFTLLLLWFILSILIVCGIFFPDNDKLGSLTYAVIIEAVILFVAELVWECILSAVV